jgi:hypothetical protein
MLLSAGVPVVPALRTARGVIAPHLRGGLDAATGRVEQGQRLSEALLAEELVTPVSVRMLRVGERSGSVGPMLGEAAAFYDEELARLTEVVTRLDPRLLTEMSIAGGGAYVPAGTANVDMGEVYEEVVAATGRREFETVATKRTLPQFQWFAGLALALLVVEGCIGLRGRRIGDGATARRTGDVR